MDHYTGLDPRVAEYQNVLINLEDAAACLQRVLSLLKPGMAHSEVNRLRDDIMRTLVLLEGE